ncbi:MAG: heavy metal translocating P-type ATPase [Deltaproteobacteria bacterium]|nr:heavy metal translocating P-type ATPase [Deltaproteobacteria bacterium]
MTEKSSSLTQCEMSVGGMDCADCAVKIEKAVGDLSGVAEAKVNFISGRLSAHFDPRIVSEGSIRQQVIRLGYQVKSSASSGSVTFRVEGMDCADETGIIEKHLRSLEGVIGINFQPRRGGSKGSFRSTADRCREHSKGHSGNRYESPPSFRGDRASESWWFRHKLLVFTIVSGLFTAAGIFHEKLHLQDAMTFPLYLVAMLTGGWRIAIKGYQEIRHRSLGMNFLMTVAVVGAAAIGEWSKGAMVVFLFAVANLLESYSMDRARRAIRSLMDLTPPDALVVRDGLEKRMRVDEVLVNDTVIIRPGEKIPLDGEVLSGNSTVNQAPITGESMPIPKATGDQIFAGTINQAGSLEIRVTHPSDDTTFSRIIHLVEEAQEQKAPSQRFVDQFARIYTPVVLVLAVLVAFMPTLILAHRS